MDRSTGSFPAGRRASKAYPNPHSLCVALQLNQELSRWWPQCRAPPHVLQKTLESLSRAPFPCLQLPPRPCTSPPNEKCENSITDAARIVATPASTALPPC